MYVIEVKYIFKFAENILLSIYVINAYIYMRFILINSLIQLIQCYTIIKENSIIMIIYIYIYIIKI